MLHQTFKCFFLFLKIIYCIFAKMIIFINVLLILQSKLVMLTLSDKVYSIYLG